MALQKLGWGHFSTVWLVFDIAEDRVAALKIQKSASRYTEAAQDEVEMLGLLNSHKGEARHLQCIVTLLDHFFHHGPNGKHMCMVFEVMGQSLLSLIKSYNYRVSARLYVLIVRGRREITFAYPCRARHCLLYKTSHGTWRLGSITCIGFAS
jgi:serine/threonine protein kinase